MADSTCVLGTPVTPAPVGAAADCTSPNGNGHSEVVADSGVVTLSLTDTAAVLSYTGNGDSGLTTGYIQSDTAGRGVIRITSDQVFSYNGTGSTLASLAAASGAETLFVSGRSVSMTTGTLTALGAGSTALHVVAHGAAGLGAIGVSIDGDILSQAGNGLVLDQNDSGATGNVLLTSTAGNTIASGAGDAVTLITSGSGTITVDLADAVLATGGAGVVVRDSANGGDIAVTVAAVSALSAGEDAVNIQSLSKNADVAIRANGALSAGDEGIRAEILDSAANGNITITAHGTINAENDGIDASNFGTGSISIDARGAVTAAHGDGILARTSGGAITVTTSATTVISGGEQGIDLQQTNAAGSGAISVTSSSATSGTDGIRALNFGSGAVTVNANRSVTGFAGDAINVVSTSAAAAAITVTTTAGETLSASGGEGIDVHTAGSGDVTVTNAAAINSGSAANTLASGIDVISTGTGNISASNSASIGATSDRAQVSGIGAAITNTASAGTLSVTGSGAIFAVGNGIDLFTSGTGSASVAYSGAINTATGDGIQVDTTSGSTTVSNSGAISTASGNGIRASSTTGNQTVTVGAAINSGGLDGVRAVSTSGTIAVNVTGGNVSAADDAVDVSSGGAKIVTVGAGRTLSGGDLGIASTGSGATTISNSGTITGTGVAIRSDTSVTTLNNLAGATINGAVRLSGLNDTVTNAGAIAGAIDLGAGDDLYDGRNGSISGTVTGNAGNDTLRGGAGAERMVGGSGADILEGNGGADVLTGGADNDIFRGEAAGLNGDTITDFASGDRIVIRDANLDSFTFSLSGNTLTFSGGSLTLTGFTGQLQASAAAGGGVQLTVVGSTVNSADNDFNGDGLSDLAWLHSSGTFTTWLGQSNGSFVNNPGSGANPLDPSWRIVGLGDFNGDGRDDILWRHSSGVIGEWLGQASGPFVNNGGAAANAVDNGWSVVGVADYNGDGRDDLFWRHTSGAVTEWLGQANGSFINNSGAAANSVDNSWTVVASGDFNGDGRGDVLWRHSSGAFAEWRGTSTGAMVNAGPVLAGATGSVVGSGDFNGDGKEDVLLRNTASGAITVWLAQASGQFTSVTPTRQISDLNWKIAAIGDYNGDGKDDLVWRHISGEGGEWLSTGTGDFAYNGAIPTVDPSWRIQSPDIFLV